MRKLCLWSCFFLLLLSEKVAGQFNTDLSPHNEQPVVAFTDLRPLQNEAFVLRHRQTLALEYAQWDNIKLITIQQADRHFSKVYFVDDTGQAVGAGFVNSGYWLPSDQKVSISNYNQGNLRDSFNPSGAVTIGEALVTGAFNFFVNGFRKKGR